MSLRNPIPFALLLGATLSAGWAEEELKVSIEQVPAAVKAAILKAADGATITEIEQETEDGQIFYEAEWANADGKTETEVTIAVDGTVLKIETEAVDEDDKHKDGDAKK